MQQEKPMTLDDFNKRIISKVVFQQIKGGFLDHAIQSEDCQDIINGDPELKKAVEERLEVLRCSKK